MVMVELSRSLRRLEEGVRVSKGVRVPQERESN